MTNFAPLCQIADMLPNELVKTKGFRMKIVPSNTGFRSTAIVNVELLGRKLAAKVSCDLVPESGIRLLETYKSVRINTNVIDLVCYTERRQFFLAFHADPFRNNALRSCDSDFSKRSF
jgi:hypothetical protein